MVFSYYGYELIRDSDLAHHGILGQKWGIRRYQNADGSLTSAGKKRYSAQIEKDFNKQNQRVLSSGHSLESEYSNTHEVKKKVRSEYENTPEHKDFVKKMTEAGKLFAKTEDPSIIGTSKGQEAINRYNKYMMDVVSPAMEADGRKYLEIKSAHHSEFLGARLKDLGHEDTAYGREVMDELLKKRKFWADV